MLERFTVIAGRFGQTLGNFNNCGRADARRCDTSTRKDTFRWVPQSDVV